VKLYLILLFLISYPALAIKGEYADKSHELASTCKLVLKIFDPVKNKVLSGLCSSSFVGKKSFLTAAHCLSDTNQALSDHKKGLVPEAPYFQCPQSETHYPLISTVDISSGGNGSDYDFGMIKVKDSPSIPEIRSPASTQEADELLQDMTKCFINGYGLDNEEKYGTLRAAQVIDLDTKPLSLGSAPPMVRVKKNFGDHGDSGGPMYCNGKDGPVLIGVIHGKQKSSIQFSDIHRVDKVTDWLSYHRNNENSSNEKFAKIARLEETCQSIDECFAKLEGAAKLSKDMSLILKALNKNVRDVKSKAVAGNEVTQKELDKSWDEMIEVWEKQDCYKVLYP
jgi:Trypsin